MQKVRLVAGNYVQGEQQRQSGIEEMAVGHWASRRTGIRDNVYMRSFREHVLTTFACGTISYCEYCTIAIKPFPPCPAGLNDRHPLFVTGSKD